MKKLHKLLYYCQGHHLGAFGRPLFPESISAWDMGPVVGTLWRAEKQGSIEPGPPITDEAVLNTIGYVVSRYGNLTGSDLERLTYTEDLWRDVDRNRAPGGSVRIPNDEIERFFRDNAADPEEIGVDAAELAAWLRRSSPDHPTLSVDTVESIRSRGQIHG
ncbi:Panacea domain-containing protein [Nakamurella sp.]|uniref:Panacea domain-containing protein n=1 Tax=Nakamurella sp. TaxID=1869182 RepID=UPI003783E625